MPPADRDPRLAFFGEVTASMSHELGNVLAILKELSGLSGDLLAASGRGRPLDTARLADLVARMDRSLRRGEDDLRQLNRFAHSVDTSGDSTDLGDTVDRLIVLCRRLADMRRVQIVRGAPGGPVTARGHPFDVFHAAFRCLDAALAASPRDGSLTVGATTVDGTPQIVFAGGEAVTSGGEARDKLALARAVATPLGAVVDGRLEPGTRVLAVLVFPPA
jgi:signal transduction histidine kinase